MGLSGGPVLLGDNLTALPEERLNMYTLCLPPYGVSARPVDFFKHDFPRVWDMKVKTDWDSWDIVGVFNYGDEEAVVTVDFTDIRIDTEKEYLVWEFWNQEFLGIHKGRVKVTVDSVKVLLIKELRSHPVVLSTSFHLSQGGVELSRVTWDSQEKKLEGVCHRVPGAQGEIFFYVPAGFAIVECKVGKDVISAEAVALDIWKVSLELRDSAVDWQVKFYKTAG